MSLHDRDYSRGSGGGWRDAAGGAFSGGAPLRRVFDFLNLSFPIGRVFGIRIRVHILFVLLVIFWVWPNSDLMKLGVGAGEQMLWNLRWMALLFGSVLLHEFGHCFGCRAVGGEANEILMWPLGGLAFCNPPRRPWPEFVTVACGPLVTLALAAIGYLSLFALSGNHMPVSLNPFESWVAYAPSAVARLLADLFVVNYALLLFNVLMIFYPFDGGRLVQIGLWKIIGYERSMRAATAFGMVGAVGVACVGLIKVNFLLVMIAVFGFINCVQQRRALRYAEYEPDADPRFAAAYETSSGQRGAWFGAAGNEDRRGEADAPRRPGMFARWRAARADKQATAQRRRAHADEAEMDRILDKVRASGLQSLSKREQQTLQRASERRRSA